MARSLGLKTIAWAQGIGPLKRSQTRWIAQQAFRRCSAISVRDRGSLDWVKRWHLEAILAPDPVWALAAQPAPALPDGPAPRIAVVLRSHPLLTSERIDCIGQALQQVQAQTRGTILLVPFQQSQDLGVAELLHHQLSPNGLTPSSEIIALTDPRQLKGVFQTVDMAIAMRLHGLMMAAAEGCRCFGISYDPKVQRLMEEIQCPGWDLAALPSDPAVMAQQWTQVLNAKATLSPAQRQTLIEQALQHRQCFDV